MADSEMMLDPVALTGRLTAALRARESQRADRLFADPFAERLAGAVGLRLLDDFGDNSTISVRTRFFDDLLTEVAGSGVEQFVIVAAGMDSRTYRLGFPSGATVFELDRPEVLRLKDSLLSDVAPRVDRRPVGVDLATDWSGALTGAGFEPGRRTGWLVEGLTQYLTEPDVLGLLDRVTALSSAGSELLIDLVGQSLLDSPVLRPMLDWFAERDMTWRYGTDRPEDLLTARGWRPEVTLINEVGTRWGRWPFPHAPRDTPGVGQGYFVRATR